MEAGIKKEYSSSNGINFGFEQDKFYVYYESCNRPVGNLRQEFETRARNLSIHSKKLLLCLSSGLDSQSVLHSFYSQGIKIDCAFLYQPGFNEVEYTNIKFLEKKYNFTTNIIEINPEQIKHQVLELHKSLDLPPNQILHKLFLEKLPKDLDILQGVHGPDFYRHENKWYLFESANSLEISRLRALQTVERTGKIIGFERTSEIMLSLLDDDILKSFLHSYDYIKNNRLIYDNGDNIPNIDYWDLYLKPFYYGKYWKDELEYFPKYQGCENIDYIINGPKNQYEKNRVFISYEKLLKILKSTVIEKKVFYQYQ